MKTRCIIIDDEPLAIKVVETHLKEFPDMELVETFSSPIDAISTINKGDIDVMFLDINMPKMNGLDFIRNLESRPYVIITTAYREFAVESFDLNVLDYLVKPIPFGRFLKAINKLNSRIQLESDKASAPVLKEELLFF